MYQKSIAAVLHKVKHNKEKELLRHTAKHCITHAVIIHKESWWAIAKIDFSKRRIYEPDCNLVYSYRM